MCIFKDLPCLNAFGRIADKVSTPTYLNLDLSVSSDASLERMDYELELIKEDNRYLFVKNLVEPVMVSYL